MEQLLKEPAARVLADAFAHCKFIGYVEPAQSVPNLLSVAKGDHEAE